MKHRPMLDRKSTRLNSSHTVISYAVFCLKKKKPNHALALIEQAHTDGVGDAVCDRLVGIEHVVEQREVPPVLPVLCFFFNDTAPPEIYTLSLHDALPISRPRAPAAASPCAVPKGRTMTPALTSGV